MMMVNEELKGTFLSVPQTNYSFLPLTFKLTVHNNSNIRRYTTCIDEATLAFKDRRLVKRIFTTRFSNQNYVFCVHRMILRINNHISLRSIHRLVFVMKGH